MCFAANNEKLFFEILEKDQRLFANDFGKWCKFLFEYPSRGSYRCILVMREKLILFSVKREFRKLFFVIGDLKVLRDPSF